MALSSVPPSRRRQLSGVGGSKAGYRTPTSKLHLTSGGQCHPQTTSQVCVYLSTPVCVGLCPAGPGLCHAWLWEALTRRHVQGPGVRRTQELSAALSLKLCLRGFLTRVHQSPGRGARL